MISESYIRNDMDIHITAILIELIEHLYVVISDKYNNDIRIWCIRSNKIWYMQ